MTDTQNEIYSGVASFGRIWALVGAISATVIGLLFFAIGVYTLRKEEPEIVEGTIVSINDTENSCSQIKQNPPTFSCSIIISSSSFGTPKLINYSGDRPYSVGEKVSVYIYKNEITLNKPVPRWVGWLCVGISLLVIIGSWTWYWITKNYKVAAATQGAGGILSILSGSLK